MTTPELRKRIPADKARKLADSLCITLTPYADAIMVTGSLRRQIPTVGDIEILAIPKYRCMVDLFDTAIRHLILQEVLDYRLNINGSRTYGPQNKYLFHKPTGYKIDIFSTTYDNWPCALVLRTGGEETCKRIARAALTKGWHWKPYGSGFSTPNGGFVTCYTETDVFDKVGLRYIEPWARY